MDVKNVFFVSDMDDTLFNNEKCISDRNLAAIRTFQKNGGLFTIATGRSITGFKPYQKQLGIYIPVVLYNGACVYDYKKKSLLWLQELPKLCHIYLYDLLQKFPKLGVQVMTEYGIFSCRSTPHFCTYMERENLPYKEVETFEEICGHWLKAELVLDQTDSKEVDCYLRDYPLKGCRCVTTGEYARELMEENVSKGSAVSKMCDLLRMKEKTLCCIGDHNNDYEMIHMADIGFAVENALEEIKEAADVIVSDNEHDAVAEAIKFVETY